MTRSTGGIRHLVPAALSAALMATVFSLSASASLGGDANSVQADRVRMQGALIQVTNNGAYAVHEMRAASGTTVREFVSTSGAVFGVAWQGPAIPDLRQILGAYFLPFTQAAQAARAQRSGHGPIAIATPDFVVEQSGHPRAFTGRAYIPQLVPAGVLTDSIR